MKEEKTEETKKTTKTTKKTDATKASTAKKTTATKTTKKSSTTKKQEKEPEKVEKVVEKVEKTTKKKTIAEPKEESKKTSTVKKAPTRKKTTKKKDETEKNDEPKEEIKVEEKAKKKTSTKKTASKKAAKKKTEVAKEDDDIKKDEVIEKKENVVSEEKLSNNEKLNESIAKLTSNSIEEIKKKIQEEVKEESEGIIINEPKSKKKTKTIEKKLQEQLQEEIATKHKKRQKRNKIIITILIILILIIIAVVLVWNFKTTTETHEFYQWTYGQKIKYTGEVETVRGTQIVGLKSSDENMGKDSTPIYFADKKNLAIMPKNMAVIYTEDNTKAYKLNNYTEVIREENNTYLSDGKKNKEDNALLYDGEDLYFFLNTTRITINGTNYELSPLSYVVVKNKQNVEMYDYEKEQYQIINTAGTHNVKISTNTYTIDLTSDTIQSLSKEESLPKDIEELPKYNKK